MIMSIPTLYHYTSLKNFFDIFEKSLIYENNIIPTHIVLWGTNCFHLNDKLEYKHFINLLSNYSKSNKQPLGENHLKILWSILKSAKIGIVSLSENNDSLPMWTSYGSNGNGISLGFDFCKTNFDEEMLMELSQNEQEQNNFDDEYCSKSKCPLKKCPMYCNCKECNAQNFDKNIDLKDCNVKRVKYLDSFANNEELYNTLYTTMESITNPVSEFFDVKIKYLLDSEAVWVKHPSFGYEKEWRIVSPIYPQSQCYRLSSNNSFIPYVPIKIPINCLKRIVLGPCLDDSRLYDVKDYLKSKMINIEDICFSQSNVPLQNI